MLQLTNYCISHCEDVEQGIEIDQFSKFLTSSKYRHLHCDKFAYYFKPEDEKMLTDLCSELKRTFSFSADIKSRISELKKQFFIPYEKLVGVHIRQGDFKDFRNGMHYFPPSAYRSIIEATLNDRLFARANIAFLIVSDEDIEIDMHFKNLPVIYCRRQSEILDLALLFEADYIISTRSTFSGWVSFLKQIPGFQLTNTSLPDWSSEEPVKASEFA